MIESVLSKKSINKASSNEHYVFVIQLVISYGYWVVCGTVHFCGYHLLHEVDGIIHNAVNL